MKVRFCGAAKDVTGSAHLLTFDNGYTLLLDCGLYQGHSKEMKDFNEHWLFNPQKVDCLILSHAHIDHSGRIPKLVKDGFTGEIHCTHATRSLAAIMLLDSARIQERDFDFLRKRKQQRNKEEYLEPLYTVKDAEQAMLQFVSHSYEQWFQINDWIEVMFLDAGHILGSASVILRWIENGVEKRFGFSGDVGRPHRPILKDPKTMPPVDYMICESTYGDRHHESAPAERAKFLSVIEETCLQRKGRVVIPAFSIGRTQEIVYLLDQLAHDGLLPAIPVYVDSPLAINATGIFAAHPECFDRDMHEYLMIDDDPFGFNHLHYIRRTEDSKALNTSHEPCVIISASGMMNAGRVKHHLFHSIEDKKDTILIVGYCAPHTPGGQLLAGAKHLKLFGERKKVKAQIVVMNSFSAHADQLELLAFLKPHRERLKELFLVHGTEGRQRIFKDKIEKFGFEKVSIPNLGDTVELSWRTAEKASQH